MACRTADNPRLFRSLRLDLTSARYTLTGRQFKPFRNTGLPKPSTQNAEISSASTLASPSSANGFSGKIMPRHSRPDENNFREAHRVWHEIPPSSPHRKSLPLLLIAL